MHIYKDLLGLKSFCNPVGSYLVFFLHFLASFKKKTTTDKIKSILNNYFFHRKENNENSVVRAGIFSSVCESQYSSGFQLSLLVTTTAVNK